jgi:hypothetical protein
MRPRCIPVTRRRGALISADGLIDRISPCPVLGVVRMISLDLEKVISDFRVQVHGFRDHVRPAVRDRLLPEAAPGKCVGETLIPRALGLSF